MLFAFNLLKFVQRICKSSYMERFENVQPEHDGYYIKDSVCELPLLFIIYFSNLFIIYIYNRDNNLHKKLVIK